jgi:hypothetical protein
MRISISGDKPEMTPYAITTVLGLPVITAVVAGPKYSKRIQLIFDSGAVSTQIHIGTLKSIGFDFHDRTPDTSIKGVTGPAERGFLVQTSRFFILGRRFQNQTLSAFDFNDWVKEGIDGLLGWDLIQQFHFEVDGPHSALIVF